MMEDYNRLSGSRFALLTEDWMRGQTPMIVVALIDPQRELLTMELGLDTWLELEATSAAFHRWAGLT